VGLDAARMGRGQVERAPEPRQRAARVGRDLLEGDLGEGAGREGRRARAQGPHDLRVGAEDGAVDVGVPPVLQGQLREGSAQGAARGGEDGVGVAVDVHDARAGEEAVEVGDLGRVGGVLERRGRPLARRPTART
jgi:hypothetical protein